MANPFDPGVFDGGVFDAGAGAGSFTADAVVLRSGSGSFVASATLRASSGTKTFTADAVLAAMATVSGSFSAAAILRRSTSGSFTAKAVLKRSTSGSWSADARFRVVRSGSFTANTQLFKVIAKTLSASAVFYRYGYGSFVAQAILFKEVLPTPTASGPASTVAITYDGVDITADVDIASANFESLVNGQPGQASLRVRDDGHTHSFAAGKELTLDINGKRFWGGYVINAQRTFPLYIVDTSLPADTERYWALTCVDYNILFSKRVVFDAANPATHIDFPYPAGTYDKPIILDIFYNYLSGAAGDGLDPSGIQQVDVAILDIPGVTSGVDANGRKNTGGSVASAGMTWQQMMDQIRNATGGIYYIDADKVINYVDVDTQSNPYSLIDSAPGARQAAYQDLLITFAGTNLINDMLVIGGALGIDFLTAVRVEDATSIAAHGRWQNGKLTNGLYRQASVTLAANTVVYGTPQNVRGHKDDAVSAHCKVFLPVFRAGQKVHFFSADWGFDDILPIRRMATTFVNPTTPVFDLYLSHEIDQPWSTFEVGPYPVIPAIAKPVVPVIELPGLPPVLPGITDTWTRTVSGWTVADCGLTWSSGAQGSQFSVDGSQGHMLCPISDHNNGGSFNLMGVAPTYPLDYLLTGTFADTAIASTNNLTIFFSTGSLQLEVSMSALMGHSIVIDPVTNEFIPLPGVNPASPWKLRVHMDNANTKVKWWQASDTEPGLWSVLAYPADIDPTSVFIGYTINHNSYASGELTLLFDELDITSISGPGTPGTPTTGYICEYAVYTGDGHVWQLSNSFVLGTTEAFVNGLRQIRGITYGEDPLAGTLTFDVARDNTSLVYVCYTATGSI